MQSHNDKLYRAYDVLHSNGINVYSVKTDCFTIKRGDLEKAKELLNFDDGIGSWRVSKTEDIIMPFESLKIKPCLSFTFDKPVVSVIDVVDEWDTDELCGYDAQYKRVMVRAEYGGCGKSFSCQATQERGHNVLFFALLIDWLRITRTRPPP